MKYCYIVLVCIVYILLNGCSNTTLISGTYSNKKNLNRFELFPDSTYIYTSLQYNNSSFTNKFSEGKWRRIDKNTIVLNSRITNNIIPLQIEKMNAKDSSLQVCENLIIIKNRNLYEYKVEDFLVTPYIDGINYLDQHPELSDEPLQITKKDFRVSIGLEPDTINPSEIVMTSPPVKRGSYCIYPEKPFNTLYFKIEKQPKTLSHSSYYSLRTEKVDIPVQFGELVKVNISVNDSLFSFRIFDNEIIKISGNKLIFKDKEDNNKVNKLHIKD